MLPCLPRLSVWQMKPCSGHLLFKELNLLKIRAVVTFRDSELNCRMISPEAPATLNPTQIVMTGQNIFIFSSFPNTAEAQTVVYIAQTVEMFCSKDGFTVVLFWTGSGISFEVGLRFPFGNLSLPNFDFTANWVLRTRK